MGGKCNIFWQWRINGQSNPTSHHSRWHVAKIVYGAQNVRNKAKVLKMTLEHRNVIPISCYSTLTNHRCATRIKDVMWKTLQWLVLESTFGKVTLNSDDIDITLFQSKSWQSINASIQNTLKFIFSLFQNPYRIYTSSSSSFLAQSEKSIARRTHESTLLQDLIDWELVAEIWFDKAIDSGTPSAGGHLQDTMEPALLSNHLLYNFYHLTKSKFTRFWNSNNIVVHIYELPGTSIYTNNNETISRVLRFCTHKWSSPQTRAVSQYMYFIIQYSLSQFHVLAFIPCTWP